MFFSIVVPVYNVEKYIERCLDSIILQDFIDYQLVIVDDGSTDSSGKICDRYMEKNGEINIEVVHQENMGLASARNAGITRAQGEWLLFIDSDDEIVPNMLGTLHDRIIKYPAELYCYNFESISDDGQIIERHIYNFEHQSINISNEKDKFSYYKDRLTLHVDGWEAWNRCYKNSIIQGNNMCFMDCDQVFAEDYCFMLEYVLHIAKIQLLCDVFYRYRQRDGSIMNELKQKTILPRLFNLICYTYMNVKKLRFRHMSKNFEHICFGILNFHIIYKLDKLTDEEIKLQLNEFCKNRNASRWIRKMKKNIGEYSHAMSLRPWL